LAWASYSFIERPFIRFSKNLCSRISIPKRIFRKDEHVPDTKSMGLLGTEF
jgi:peptidoglycan/LPS O-acetylase OafA/YrhL